MSTKKLQVLGTFGTIDGKTASDFLNTITLTTVFDENFNVLATTDATVILDSFATDYQDNAKYVFIPSSVTEVSPGAFYYCTNITDVFIDNVKGGVDVDSFMVVDQLGHTTEIWPFSTSTNLHYVQGSNTLIGLLLQINSKSGDSITDVYTKTEVDDALDKKANTDEVENSLAEKETIDNKIIDKRFITDSKTNYPSIAFLEDYYYNVDEIDELLDKKANSADVGTALAQKANATDVYEVISVKNILNISPYTNTINGITVAVDANNHITISGTASKYTLIQDIPINCILETGAKYTLSTQNSAKLGTNDSSVSIALGGHTSTSILTINYEGLDNSKTFTAEADAEFLLLQVASGKTVNVECDIQLEKGEEYTEFTPPNAVEGYISKLSLQDGSVSKEKLNEELQNKIDVIPKMNYLYVSLDYQEDEEGFGETKFNSILDANNSITDNDEFNRYTIIIKAGTYNEFEERYAGSTDTSKLQGIETKNYVYYESENINNPSECVLSWDGAVGYDDITLTDAMAVKKCIFHIKGGGYLEEGMHTHIKGFTITSKNTRYGLHIESGGYGRNVNWLVENCIIEYGGRPNIANSVLQPVLGMGMSPFECGEIRKCVIKYSDDTTWNSDTDTPKAIVCHNNSDATVYANKPPVIAGAELNIKDCKFNDNTVTFSTKPNTVLSDTKFTIHLDNNVGISSVDNSEAWLLTDGISPETTNATITHTWDGTILTITTDSGTSSADLKGEQGIQGEAGADGKDGIDGVSPTVIVAENTDTSFKLSITNANGTITTPNLKGADGANGTDGKDGTDGYTPVKGIDYFSEYDKTEIINAVIEYFGGKPISGYVDESNNIVINGNLSDGTYLLKYENADGTYTDIGTLDVGEVEVIINLFTTYTPILNKRWSNSSKAWSAQNGCVGFELPMSDVVGKTMRFSGFQKTYAETSVPAWYAVDDTNTKVAQYDIFSVATVDEENNTYSWVVPNVDGATKLMAFLPVRDNAIEDLEVALTTASASWILTE